MARLIFILPVCLLFANCKRDGEKQAGFDSNPTIVTVQPAISEVSGIADSKRNPGYLWAHEDGGNPPELHLVNHNGNVLKRIYIDGITNRDWEEMALAGNDLYIGEIGDNNGIYAECAFYKFPEPLASVDTIRSVEKIRFHYTDGPRDAEAFIVDPATKAIYIITKRESQSRIYKLTPPFTTGVHVAELAGQLSYGGVVSAAISPDGKEMIVKTYGELRYYKLNPGEKIETALTRQPVTLPYRQEPQGEAVCFSAKNNGYFTLSELGQGTELKLYFYKRN